MNWREQFFDLEIEADPCCAGSAAAQPLLHIHAHYSLWRGRFLLDFLVLHAEIFKSPARAPRPGHAVVINLRSQQLPPEKGEATRKTGSVGRLLRLLRPLSTSGSGAVLHSARRSN